MCPEKHQENATLCALTDLHMTFEVATMSTAKNTLTPLSDLTLLSDTLNTSFMLSEISDTVKLYVNNQPENG